MVANLESCVNDKAVVSECYSDMIDRSIILFLCKNPGRVLIVDFLNVMIGGAFGARRISELCDILISTKPATPIIIVSKKVSHWPNIDADDAVEITKKYPNILILVCNTRDAKKRPYIGAYGESLAEADDHLICSLRYAICAIRCDPIVLTEDKYRNHEDVFKTIPKYEYTSYAFGNAERHYIDQKFIPIWTVGIVCGTVTMLEYCFYIQQRCRNCRKANRNTCMYCMMCFECKSDILGLITSTFAQTPPNCNNPCKDLRDGTKDEVH